MIVSLLNIVGQEFLGIPLFDQDLYKLLLLLGINLFTSFILLRFIYYPKSEKKGEYLFAMMSISFMVFFLTFALKKFEFQTGVALGLFAIFGIVRFRTAPMPIKEMSYLFAIMGLSMLHALSNNLSLMEIGIADGVVLLVTMLMEIFIMKPKVVEEKLAAPLVEEVVPEFASKDLVYGWLENVKPANRDALIKDLNQKTGLDIVKVKTKSLNLKRGEAVLTVFYKHLEDY